MLNAVMSEIYKCKKNKIFYVCSGIVLLAALYGVYNGLILGAPPDASSWIPNLTVITTLILSIASGFVITFLVQREYEDKTIINVLAAPTSRVVFVLSKLAIWFIWYVLVLTISIIIYIIGGNLIFPGNFGATEIKLLFEMVVKTRLLSFVASTPLLFIAVVQRRTFYPTIMFSLVFTGIELLAYMVPVKFGSIIPWTAAMISGYGMVGEYLIRAFISIFASGVLGVIGACVVFKKQNQ